MRLQNLFLQTERCHWFWWESSKNHFYYWRLHTICDTSMLNMCGMNLIFPMFEAFTFMLLFWRMHPFWYYWRKLQKKKNCILELCFDGWLFVFLSALHLSIWISVQKLEAIELSVHVVLLLITFFYSFKRILDVNCIVSFLFFLNCTKIQLPNIE